MRYATGYDEIDAKLDEAIILIGDYGLVIMFVVVVLYFDVVYVMEWLT